MGKLTGSGADDNQGTDWEGRYRVGDCPWDRGGPVPSIAEALDFFPEGSNILVPGCGLGHDAAALERAGHRVEGWDVSPSAITSARRQYESQRLRFFCRDVLRNSSEPESFDGIFEHTFLCAIGPAHWPTAAEEYARLLKPHGHLFAVLFTHIQEDNPPPWPISPQKVEEMFYKNFRIEKATHPHTAFPGREGEETLWRMIRRG